MSGREQPTAATRRERQFFWTGWIIGWVFGAFIVLVILGLTGAIK